MLGFFQERHKDVNKEEDVDNEDSDEGTLDFAQVQTSLIDAPVVGSDGEDEHEDGKHQHLHQRSKNEY